MSTVVLYCWCHSDSASVLLYFTFAGPQLKCVATMSVGYEHIDIEECRKRNIAVGYTPDVLTNAVAEHTMMLLLAVSRRLKEGNSHLLL